MRHSRSGLLLSIIEIYHLLPNHYPPEYVVVFGQNTALAPQSGRKLDVPEVWVFKMRDGKVAESWMLNQDTVAILEFLKEDTYDSSRQR